jgi:signal transduction histidine kinase
MRKISTALSPRLRTILLFMNLMVLTLPLASIFFFRFYENELVRQTEQELIAQSAVLSGTYIQSLTRELGERSSSYGIPAVDEKKKDGDYGPYNPIVAQLDLLNDPIGSPRPDGKMTETLDPSSPEAKAGQDIDPIIEETKKVTLAGIRILDYKGRVVSSQDFGTSYADIPEIESALKGRYTSVLRERISDHPRPALASISRGAYVRVFVAYPIIHNHYVWGVVSISRTPKNVLQYMYEEQNKLVVAAIALILATLLITALTSRLVIRPLSRLMMRIEGLETGRNYDEMGRLFSVREFDELSGYFERTTKSIRDQSDYIKNFAMHMSHEFKTPLTSMRGAAEILEDHKDLSEPEKSRFIALILKDVDRLRQLVTRLLELARADHATKEHGTTHLNELFLALKKRYASQSLELTWNEIEDFTINLSMEETERVFTNLLDNALAHGANRVEISCAADDKKLLCRVQDNGEGISPENFDKIFTPFFTTRRAKGGTGLGLDIVKSILNAHGGNIEVVKTASDQGACFVVCFRLS